MRQRVRILHRLLPLVCVWLAGLFLGLLIGQLPQHYTTTYAQFSSMDEILRFASLPSTDAVYKTKLEQCQADRSRLEYQLNRTRDGSQVDRPLLAPDVSERTEGDTTGVLLQQLEECRDQLSHLEQAGCSCSREEEEECERDERRSQNEETPCEMEKQPDDAHNSLCSYLFPNQTLIPTATTLWMQHLYKVLNATQLVPNDDRFVFHDFTLQLLQILSPRLASSTRTLPRDWKIVERVLQKAVARIRYLQRTGPEAPPVSVVVLGGSVLVGRNCRKLVKDLDLPYVHMPQRECNFAYRLQEFVNRFLWMMGVNDNTTDTNDAPQVIELTRLALGGTNTETATRLFEYDLLPLSSPPDIVVNAYSTNDMHILTILQAGNQTLRSKLLDLTQDFCRQVLKTCHDHRPLLLFLDDYLGNEQREITSILQRDEVMTTVASYYGVSYVSYANVVRDLVHGDTRETWFSPDGWYKDDDPKTRQREIQRLRRRPDLWRAIHLDEPKTMQREIHPGMGAHIAMMWVVAYHWLHLTTTYCSLQPYYSDDPIVEYNQSKLATKIRLWNWKTDVPGRPQTLPLGLPPPLTDTLRLDDISEQWRKASTDAKEHCSDGRVGTQKCLFSWVGGLTQQQNNQTWVQEYFGKRLSEETKWTLANDGEKLGWVPPAQQGATMVLEFVNVTQPLTSITFFTMRSYGAKWKDSRILVEVFGRLSKRDTWQNLTTDTIVGFHDKNTSEMYTGKIRLPSPGVAVGGDLRLCYSLVDGTTFKIMGLAVCS